MSTPLLRETAALIRERATGAADAWGADRWSAGETGYDDRQGLTYDIRCGGALVAAAGCEELSEHIAAWHPQVALAVADWLDATADDWDRSRSPIPPWDARRDARRALAVARAYLGRDA